MYISTPDSLLSTAASLFRLLTLFFIFGTGLASAAPPVPNACDPSTIPDKGDRLKCHFDNVAAQQTTTAEMISEMPEIPMNQKKAMMNTAMRGKKAQDRAKGNDYKQLTKKAAVQCQVAEYIPGKGDDDGVCTAGEDCSEELGDGIGDEDGICKPLNGKNREVCVQICDAEGIDDNPDNFDNAVGDTISDDLEAQLVDSTEQYAELNTELETMMVASAALQAAAVSSGDCSAVFEARAPFTAGLIASQVAVTLRGVAGQFSTVCDLDVAGFNAAVACLVTETLAAMAEIVDDSLEYLSSEIDSDTMDATYACLQDVNTTVGESNDALDEIKLELENVNTRLDTMQQKLDQANQNLLTPQGQRDGFNK
jgi:hypothetical protein